MTPIEAFLRAKPGYLKKSASETARQLGLGPESYEKIREVQRAVRSGDPPPEKSPQGPGGWSVDDGYSYNEARDHYVFFLKCHPEAPVPIPGTVVRRICESYSDFDRVPATINQIAISEGLPRNEVIEILRVLGKTHDSDPYTPEQLKESSVEDLVEDSLQKVRRRYKIKLEQKAAKEREKSAELWEEAEYNLVRTIDTLLSRSNPPQDILSHIPPILRLEEGLPRGCALCNTQDLHIGNAVALGDVSLEEYKESILTEFNAGLAKAARLNTLDEIVMTLGGDVCHIDTAKAQTSSGRPMIVSHVPERIVLEAEDLLIRMVAVALRYRVPVKLYYVQGNHDKLLGLALASSVMNYYRNEPLVESTLNYHPRQYHRYEDHLFMLTHFLGGDVQRYPGKTFMAEAGALVGQTRYRHVYVGHLHHLVTEADKQGVMFRQAPAPIYNDDYHLNFWPNARRQVQIVIHEPYSCDENVFNLDVGKHYTASPTVYEPEFLRRRIAA